MVSALELGPPQPFGGPALLRQLREVLLAIEKLPTNSHTSKLSDLIGQAAYGLQKLQSTGGNYSWPAKEPLQEWQIVRLIPEGIGSSQVAEALLLARAVERAHGIVDPTSQG